jgi:hypothetical protein
MSEFEGEENWLDVAKKLVHDVWQGRKLALDAESGVS